MPHPAIMAPRPTICFKVSNRVYSITRIRESKVEASLTLDGRRLRGRPKFFNPAKVLTFHVRDIVRRGN